MDSFLHIVEPFIPYGQQHIGALLLSFIIGLVIIISANKNLTDRQKWLVGLTLSFIPFLAYLFRTIILIQQGGDLIQDELPLHICRIVTIFLPIMVFFMNRKLFAILYFWIMAGTTNAILTPDLQEAFPHYSAWGYFLMHCGEIIAVLYALFVLKLKIKPKDILLAFLAANTYFIIIHGFNTLMDTNYMYTMRKPPAESILDYFGEWPMYIIVTQFIGLGLFILLYLPFLMSPKIKKA